MQWVDATSALQCGSSESKLGPCYVILRCVVSLVELCCFLQLPVPQDPENLGLLGFGETVGKDRFLSRPRGHVTFSRPQEPHACGSQAVGGRGG